MNELLNWLKEQNAAHEGGDNVYFDFDEATFQYIIYKRRPHGVSIRLGSGRTLEEALKEAMNRNAPSD